MAAIARVMIGEDDAFFFARLAWIFMRGLLGSLKLLTRDKVRIFIIALKSEPEDQTMRAFKRRLSDDK